MIKIVKIIVLLILFIPILLISVSYAITSDEKPNKKETISASHLEILKEFKEFRDAQARLLGKKASSILSNDGELMTLIKSGNYFPKPHNGYCECQCNNETKTMASNKEKVSQSSDNTRQVNKANKISDDLVRAREKASQNNEKSIHQPKPIHEDSVSNSGDIIRYEEAPNQNNHLKKHKADSLRKESIDNIKEKRNVWPLN